MIQTNFPSVTAEGEAEFCLRNIWFPASICCCHRIDPSFRLIASRNSLSAPLVGPIFRAVPRSPSRGDSGSAEVIKTVCSQTIGVAALQLGSLVRQRTFSVSDQVTGKS